MIKDNLKLKGDLTIVLKDKDGRVKERRKETNRVVDVGLGFICSRMINAGTPVMSNMAIGSGTDTPSAGQTDLTSALSSRVALDSITQVSNTVTYVASFSTGEGTGAVTEAGIFNNSDPDDTVNSNIMLCRTTFPVINKQADDTMLVTWTITLTANP